MSIVIVALLMNFVMLHVLWLIHAIAIVFIGVVA